MQDFFGFADLISLDFRMVLALPNRGLDTPIAKDTLFILTEDCVALHYKTVQNLESWQIPEQIINFLFLVKVDVQAAENRHRH